MTATVSKDRNLVPRALGLIASVLFAFAACGGAHAQGGAAPGAAVPKAAPAVKTATTATEAPKPPEMKVAGNFGSWALVCTDTKDAGAKESCSLVQALIEHDSKKLVFRLTVAYGPKGNLVLRIDSPNGVALQKGLEFSPDAVKIYRMPFETCLPGGCSALLLMEDDLKHDIEKSQKGTITVYALSGQAVQAVTQLTGFSDGLAALDKRRGAKP